VARCGLTRAAQCRGQEREGGKALSPSTYEGNSKEGKKGTFIKKKRQGERGKERLVLNKEVRGERGESCQGKKGRHSLNTVMSGSKEGGPSSWGVK